MLNVWAAALLFQPVEEHMVKKYKEIEEDEEGPQVSSFIQSGRNWRSFWQCWSKVWYSWNLFGKSLIKLESTLAMLKEFWLIWNRFGKSLIKSETTLAKLELIWKEFDQIGNGSGKSQNRFGKSFTKLETNFPKLNNRLKFSVTK